MAVKKGYYKGQKVGSKEYWNMQYSTYLNKRNDLASNGFALKQKLTKSEFKQIYKQAGKLGMKNIMRTMVNEEKVVSYDLFKTIYKEQTGKNFSNLRKTAEDVKLYRDIISLNFIDEKIEKRVMEGFKNKYHREYSAGNWKQYAFFWYMSEIGTREVAEEAYGY